AGPDDVRPAERGARAAASGSRRGDAWARRGDERRRGAGRVGADHGRAPAASGDRTVRRRLALRAAARRLTLGVEARRADVPGAESRGRAAARFAGRRSSWHLARIRPLECLRPPLPLRTCGFYHSLRTAPGLLRGGAPR